LKAGSKATARVSADRKFELPLFRAVFTCFFSYINYIVLIVKVTFGLVPLVTSLGRAAQLRRALALLVVLRHPRHSSFDGGDQLEIAVQLVDLA
jgi:hypothetical protein